MKRFKRVTPFNYNFFSDSNNQRLLLGDSSMIPVPGTKGPLKPQGTVNSMKQLRIDLKK